MNKIEVMQEFDRRIKKRAVPGMPLDIFIGHCVATMAEMLGEAIEHVTERGKNEAHDRWYHASNHSLRGAAGDDAPSESASEPD